MNVSYRWLQSLLPGLTLGPREVADRLASLGAPVDAVVDVGAPLRDIRIARVLEVQRHPNADKLSLCRVDAGTGEELRVVCGAPNVRAGGFYPFAPVGATLPGGITIRKAKIRGEESQGMLCSARELALGRDHEGILELHGAFEPGAVFTEAVGLEDIRLELDITPNRPDLLSHWGVARELSVRGESEMQLPVVPHQAASLRLGFEPGGVEAAVPGAHVRLEDTAGCPRYLAAVIRDVKVAPSPAWLASRLRAIGQRPINNVVDVTNWVLHELGQPLHAFDLAKLGGRIVVRRARAGESLVTLDGVTRKLTPDMLVIADESRPVALAGIMGGADTEVTESTTDVLLECALFEPGRIRTGRRRLDLTTDASYRFERGVDPDGMERAVRRAIDLIVATAGGSPEPVVAVAEADRPEPAVITLRRARTEQVLGLPFATDEIVELLAPIGFQPTDVSGDVVAFKVPGHRRYDVSREIDLVEEVARRKGYEAFPAEARGFRPGTVEDHPLSQLEDRLRDRLVARGYLEARSLPLVSEREGAVAVLNPLSSAESRLRAALLPGLLARLETNYNRGVRHVRLFEIGTTFAPVDGEALPAEATHLAAVLTGGRQPEHWSGPTPMLDLWDLRGLLEELGAELGLELRPGLPPVSPAPAGLFEPGTEMSLAHVSDGEIVAAGGQIPADRLDAPPWAEAIFGFELVLRSWMTERRPFVLRPLPEHPPVDRDVAVIVGGDVTAGALLATIRAAGGEHLERVEPFDVYVGPNIPEGARSLAFRLRFRASDRTLTVAEVDRSMDRILKKLKEEHDAERRG